MVRFEGDDWPNDPEKVRELCCEFGDELIHIKTMIEDEGFSCGDNEDVEAAVYNLIRDRRQLKRKVEYIGKILCVEQ